MTSKVRQAVIMVGGKGTRLRPLTYDRPKPILPVLDKPCIEYLIDSFACSGIEEVILACGYRSEQMVQAIGDGTKQGISIVYSYEDEPMGTGGAIKLLEDRLDDVFVAANGDVFIDFNLQEEIDVHLNSDATVTIALTPVENPCEFGIAKTDETGRIIEFKEKPKPEEVFSNLINAGVYVVNKEVMGFVPKGTMYDFSKDLFPLIMKKGYRVQGHVITGSWRDVGRPSDLLFSNIETAERKYKGHDWSPQVTSSKTKGSLYVGEDAKATFCDLDSAVLSKGCQITDSIIRSSLLMADCVVRSAYIENSILGEGCIVKSGARVINSILGDKTVVSEKAILKNDSGMKNA
ncbi:MAG: NDP-sugar synthase [Candidatus Methanomethylophilaceae archaeon]